MPLLFFTVKYVFFKIPETTFAMNDDTIDVDYIAEASTK